jgi:serine O-acetyltransferase
MKTSLSKDELKLYLGKQLSNYFPDNTRLEGNDVDSALTLALDRLENCFKEITFPAYSDGEQTFFSHLHADQYATFLYFFMNSLWKLSENKPICDKVLYLNRMLNGFFVSYKGRMPDHFFLGHPVGTIIGNAVYNDYLVIFQNVTVNTDTDAEGNPAPVLGKGLFLGTGAKIIGNRTVGDRVSVGVDAVVYNREIPDDSVVMKAENGEVLVKKRKKEKCMAQNYFRSVI